MIRQMEKNKYENNRIPPSLFAENIQKKEDIINDIVFIDWNKTKNRNL